MFLPRRAVEPGFFDLCMNEAAEELSISCNQMQPSVPHSNGLTIPTEVLYTLRQSPRSGLPRQKQAPTGALLPGRRALGILHLS